MMEKVRFTLTVWLRYPILVTCSAGYVQSSCFLLPLTTFVRSHETSVIGNMCVASQRITMYRSVSLCTNSPH